MKLIKYIDRINLLHKLIKGKKTGSPDELATRLKLSKSRVNRIIEDLRVQGVPIEYSREMRTYFYKSDYLMKANLELRPLDDKSMKDISGGFFQTSNVLTNAFFVH